MNETALVQKVWNYAHVLRDQGVPYQSYISQISYLLFLKMDDERTELVTQGLLPANGSPIPKDCQWGRLRDLQGEELTKRYTQILDIFWLKDDTLDDPDLLPPPEEVAAEIVENLETALERFRRVANALNRS
jgi:type I restriction enzyme M protein